MPLLFIHTKNCEFQSRDDGAEYDRPESALALGVRGAMAMAVDEVAQGRPNSGLEVIVESEDGKQILRSVVVVSVCPLMISEPSAVSSYVDN